MDSEVLDNVAINAYLNLIALNMRVWKPEVALWLHSDDAGPTLRDLLVNVPCSPTVH
jgi:hypothetical protein